MMSIFSFLELIYIREEEEEEDFDLDDVDLDNLTKEEIDKMLEEADNKEVEFYEENKKQVPRLDLSGIKQILLDLEKAINKNQELRLKYSTNPLKYFLLFYT